MTVPFTEAAKGVRLAVRVTVRAKRSEICGIEAGADGRPLLAVRLAAPPVDGGANKALRRMVADLLGLPLSDVTIRSGETSRFKMLQLDGDGKDIAGRLRSILGC